MRKGSKHSEETKQKMREAREGRFGGENCPNWKGGLPNCLDCGKKLSHRKCKRCQKCANQIHTKTPEQRARISRLMSTIERTKEWNQKVGEAQKGRKLSPERIAKMSGANAYNWKGGVTPEHRKIYKSKAYKEWRQEVFERDSFTCQECKAMGVILNVHHIKPFSKFKELRMDLNNAITLCVPCHKLKHQKGWLKEAVNG